jgi:hypothetical protein
MTNNKQQTDHIVEANKMITAVEWLQSIELERDLTLADWKQAKEMEKEKHEKFNKFLNDEKQLGISDLKTVERIQWYYNTYFNETYGGGEQ